MISNYLDPVYNNAYNSVVECSTSNADTRVRFPLGVLIVWFFYSKKNYYHLNSEVEFQAFNLTVASSILAGGESYFFYK